MGREFGGSNYDQLFRSGDLMLQRATTKHHGAFTLIEVVLALGIMGLMLSIGWGALRNVAESRKLLTERQDLELVGQAIVTRLVKELQLATNSMQLMPPSNDKLTKFGPQDSFLVENNSSGVKVAVTFLALEGGQYLPDGGRHSGVVQLSYRVVPTPPSENRPADSLSLIRSELPYLLPYSKAYSQEMIFPVSHDLVDASFEFYDENQGRWTNNWSASTNTGVPALIRFSISIRSKSGRIASYSTAVAIAK